MWSLPHSDFGRTFVTKNIYRIYESKDKIKDRASPFIELESRVEYATRIQQYGVGLGEAEQLKGNKTRLEKVAVFRCIPWRKRQWRKASRHILPFILLPFL